MIFALINNYNSTKGKFKDLVSVVSKSFEHIERIA